MNNKEWIEKNTEKTGGWIMKNLEWRKMKEKYLKNCHSKQIYFIKKTFPLNFKDQQTRHDGRACTS